jgi:hypothetical protein
MFPGLAHPAGYNQCFSPPSMPRAKTCSSPPASYHALCQPEQARTHWQHALDILTRLGVPHIDDDCSCAGTPVGLIPHRY